MLASLRRRIEQLLQQPGDASAEGRELGVRLATATLLAEVARADQVLDVRELDTLRRSLRERFALDDTLVAAIVNDGLESSEEAVSLQGFTRTLHEALDAEEKARIIGMLWQVAYADGDLDKYEDALIAQIGELMYIPRSEVLRLKAVHAESTRE